MDIKELPIWDDVKKILDKDIELQKITLEVIIHTL